MNSKIIKNVGIVLGGIFLTIYGLFLLLPLILSPVIKNYIPAINEEIKKSTGLISDIRDIRIVTTPKLTAGLKLGEFILSTPDNQQIVNARDFQVKMSLLPILTKKIRVDLVKLENAEIKLAVNKDGSFAVEKFLPESDEATPDKDATQTEPQYLPMGLKLSNHFPDIKIGSAKVIFTDNSAKKDYAFNINKTQITDFVLNKGVKILSDGNIILQGREQFKYKVKINNKIMPENDLNELVFNPQTEEVEKQKQDIQINILDIFKGLYNYKITANIDADLILDENSQNGYIYADNLSVAPNGMQIPPSNAKLVFKGNRIDIDSDLYSAKDEKSKVSGEIKTGKSTNIDLNVKSGAELANIVRILNAFAVTFNIKDLQTLSANGKINADFNIKSNLKTINSNGYLKIPSAKIRYGLYDITIDKINADVALDNNNVNIKNIGFSIFNQPLTLYGKITEDAVSDLHLTANNLSLKGLIIACGQAALLKDNQVNSGLVTIKADIVGKLDKIKPVAKIILSNLNIKNIPANTTVLIPNTNIDIVADAQSFAGTALSTNIKAINPALTLSIPRLSADIKPDVIEVAHTPMKADNINFNLQGKIKDYLTDKIKLDFVTTGDIKSKLTGDMNPVRQTLNLVYSTTQESKIVIPMFDKSNMDFNCNINITGNMIDPQLSGTFNSQAINIPEIPVQIETLSAKLHGSILNGNASVSKFTSGGIIADKITTNFSMKGENFYLNNLKGNSFDGRFNGNIVYNMNNAKTSLDFKGEEMNAEKAIAGAAGIKNALTGTLSFDTKMNLTVLPDYNSMMRTLGGNLNFKITNGAFGKIGTLESFLQANNIIGNAILKTTVNSFSNIAAIKNSAQFDYITGNMSFTNGWADIKNIKSTGKTIAYFITGKYNLINNSANLVILGRLDGSIVKLLGPLGELSAEKILSYIPKLGDLTSKYAGILTTDPDKERTKDIPNLSGGTSVHKDFKVVFNGGVESTSSVKSFKWLSKANTSAIEQQSVTQTIKSFKTNVNTDIDNTVKNVKDIVNTAKEQKEQIKDSVNELKNLFKF